MVETMIKLMGAKTMGAHDVAKTLTEKGKAPKSNNLPAYISSVFSSAKGPNGAKTFESVERGRYRVADWAKSPKAGEETAPVPETAPPAKAVAETPETPKPPPVELPQSLPTDADDLLAELDIDPGVADAPDAPTTT
jgi:hypothetical protein